MLGKPPFMLPPKSPALYYIQRLRTRRTASPTAPHAKRRSMDIKKNRWTRSRASGWAQKRSRCTPSALG